MNNAVEIRNVSKRFGTETVLKSINMELEEGTITGIVGRNGSGKTVLMKCLLGFLRPEEGEITVFGKRIGKDVDFAPYTGMIIETPGFIDTESGAANLKYLQRIRPSGSCLSPESAMTLVGLDPKNKKAVSKYSLGMRQRLGIAQAVMEQPKLLVLDEPMNGLDNDSVEEMRSLLKQFRDQGVTIFLASHNPLDISELCDTVYSMDHGILQKAGISQNENTGDVQTAGNLRRTS